MGAAPPLDGGVDDRFGRVADAFLDNFRRHGETGAAVSVRIGGRTVVDIAAGVRDARSGLPFDRTTSAPVFSAGKAMVAVTAAVAVSAGRTTYDDPIRGVWPDFAAQGKGAVTLRDVLDHRSGVVLFGRRMRPADFADPRRVERVLAAARPAWPPGTAQGYHLATLGDLVAAVLRRTDPAERGFADLFRDTVAAPLGAAVGFGRAAAPTEAVARIRLPHVASALADLRRADAGLLAALRPGSLLWRALAEVRRLSPDDSRWLDPPFPSGNCIATAAGLAAVHGDMALGGRALGIAPGVFADIVGPPDPPRGDDRDRVLGIAARWRLGFTRPAGAFPFWPSPRAFGAPGLGGAFGFADPDSGLGYAYVPARLGLLPFDDRRERSLRAALLASLG